MKTQEFNTSDKLKPSRNLTELVQEVDDHVQSEAAIRKLENKVENYQIPLKKSIKESFVEEKGFLCERFKDVKQAGAELCQTQRSLGYLPLGWNFALAVAAYSNSCC